MDVLHTHTNTYTQNQPTFVPAGKDLAWSWYEDCHQSGKTTGT